MEPKYNRKFDQSQILLCESMINKVVHKKQITNNSQSEPKPFKSGSKFNTLDRDNEWNVFCDSYQKRLHALMFAYFENSDAGFYVEKNDDKTYKFGRRNYLDGVQFKVIPPISYDWVYVSNLDSAEEALAYYEHELAELKRKREVKDAALAKLTVEERELLGV